MSSVVELNVVAIVVDGIVIDVESLSPTEVVVRGEEDLIEGPPPPPPGHEDHANTLTTTVTKKPKAIARTNDGEFGRPVGAVSTDFAERDLDGD